MLNVAEQIVINNNKLYIIINYYKTSCMCLYVVLRYLYWECNWQQ